MKRLVSKHWSLFAGMIVLWLTMGILIVQSMWQNQGHIGYGLDDAYIHMAIAKSLSQHGVWGVNQYEFGSASSSILWTLLLSTIYWVSGVKEITPLILNILCASGIVLATYKWIQDNRKRVNQTYIFLIILGIIFLTPLPALIVGGMEHSLQTLLTFCFVYIAANILTKPEDKNADKIILLILTPLVALVRYENLFLIFVVCCLLALRRKWIYASMVGALAVIPVAIFGAYSVLHGSYFLPNSVLLKYSGSSKILGSRAFFNLSKSPHVLLLLLFAAILFIRRYDKQGMWEKRQVTLALAVLTTLLHMQFANTGWFYRYEAYLVALNLLAIANVMLPELPQRMRVSFNKQSIPKYFAIAVLLISCISPLTVRGVLALGKTIIAPTNIYEQQYQMGRFLKEFYQGQVIAANDIGAISYLADIKLLDLWGLGSIEVARLKRENMFNLREIFNLTQAKGTKIAIIYDHWFANKIPSQWIKVGEWTIPNNVICGGDTVSFYAVHSSEEKSLIANLKSFASQLPPEVKQQGKYINS